MNSVTRNILLGGLGLGGLVALLAGSAGSASAAPAKAFPAELVARTVDAIASGDPARMRSLAAELRALGYLHEAEQLEAKAQEVERQGRIIEPKPGAGGGGGGGGRIIEPPDKSDEERQELAARLVREFSKGQAPASTIRAFQLQEGLPIDGIYGPKTAAALIKYGFVPPTPTSWPKATAEASKTAYIALLASQSQVDPVRAEEWRIAMGKIRKGSGPGAFVSSNKLPLTEQEKKNIEAINYITAIDSAREEMTRR